MMATRPKRLMRNIKQSYECTVVIDGILLYFYFHAMQQDVNLKFKLRMLYFGSILFLYAHQFMCSV